MSLNMSSSVSALPESLATNVAGKRSFISVNQPVHLERGRPFECLVTDVAAVRPF